MSLLGDRRMDFIKSLFLVILIPFVVSSLSFASKYGENDKSIQVITEQQEKILAELQSTRSALDKVTLTNSGNAIVLGRLESQVNIQGTTLASLDREVGIVRQDINNVKTDIVKGGNERINRIEDKVFGK